MKRYFDIFQVRKKLKKYEINILLDQMYQDSMEQNEFDGFVTVDLGYVEPEDMYLEPNSFYSEVN